MANIEQVPNVNPQEILAWLRQNPEADLGAYPDLPAGTDLGAMELEVMGLMGVADVTPLPDLLSLTMMPVVRGPGLVGALQGGESAGVIANPLTETEAWLAKPEIQDLARQLLVEHGVRKAGPEGYSEQQLEQAGMAVLARTMEQNLGALLPPTLGVADAARRETAKKPKPIPKNLGLTQEQLELLGEGAAVIFSALGDVDFLSLGLELDLGDLTSNLALAQVAEVIPEMFADDPLSHLSRPQQMGVWAAALLPMVVAAGVSPKLYAEMTAVQHNVGVAMRDVLHYAHLVTEDGLQRGNFARPERVSSTVEAAGGAALEGFRDLFYGLRARTGYPSVEVVEGYEHLMGPMGLQEFANRFASDQVATLLPGAFKEAVVGMVAADLGASHPEGVSSFQFAPEGLDRMGVDALWQLDVPTEEGSEVVSHVLAIQTKGAGGFADGVGFFHVGVGDESALPKWVPMAGNLDDLRKVAGDLHGDAGYYDQAVKGLGSTVQPGTRGNQELRTALGLSANEPMPGTVLPVLGLVGGPTAVKEFLAGIT